ncbi:MAG: YidC/Oxa1 family membrane protein insertase [Acutalibacteraceae bacterium]
MNSLFDIIGIPFQYILGFFNSITGSYAAAILIFTVLVNAAMLPLNIKQQKNMAKQARLRPKLEELKKKYGDDRAKMANAQQELYANENISPTGGCLPMIIRMVLLLGVYRAVWNQIAAKQTVNFNLFGLDLSETPHFSTNFSEDMKPIWLIPILSFVAALLSMFISQWQQKKINPQMAQTGGMMIGMMLIMPIFSLYIAFQVSAAVGYYWIISNVVNTVIQLIVNQVYSSNKILASMAADEALKRKKYEAGRISK